MLNRNLNLPKPIELDDLLADLPRAFRIMLVAWVFSMIALPIVRFFFGEIGLTWGLTACVILQAVTVLLILQHAWGTARTIWTAAVVISSTWAIEALGSATGIPFGSYDYTAKLQPQIAHVPVLIPIAWLMMLPAAWAVALAITGSNRGPLFVGLSALALTTWDLFLDPQMVAWGLWVWADFGGYFGIPWTNYAGWLLAGVIITLLARPPQLPVGPLLLIYGITWLLETFGLLFFWNLPGPALIGFVGMGGMLWLAAISWQKRKPALLTIGPRGSQKTCLSATR